MKVPGQELLKLHTEKMKKMTIEDINVILYKYDYLNR